LTSNKTFHESFAFCRFRVAGYPVAMTAAVC